MAEQNSGQLNKQNPETYQQQQEKKLDMKTLIIACAIIVILAVGVTWGWDIVQPALAPVLGDMGKIFICGALCGLLVGLWLGTKLEREVTHIKAEEKAEYAKMEAQEKASQK